VGESVGKGVEALDRMLSVRWILLGSRVSSQCGPAKVRRSLRVINVHILAQHHEKWFSLPLELQVGWMPLQLSKLPLLTVISHVAILESPSRRILDNLETIDRSPPFLAVST
jgi:hypothetical protein